MNSEILKKLQKAIEETGRKVLLVAVSKKRPWEECEPLYRAGLRDFGESRLQEALSKQQEAPADIRWHLIGTLQKNKVRKAVAKFYLIHSVDSLALAEKISKESCEQGVVTRVLLQVNTTKESQKHGFLKQDLMRSMPDLLQLPGLDIQGLMTMGPTLGGAEEARPCFQELAALARTLSVQFSHPLPILSFGMSSDFQVALEEGSTALRIGSLLFHS